MSRDDNRNAMADCIVLSKQQACAITNLSADTLDRLHRKHAGHPRVQLSPRRRIMAREAQHGLTRHVTTVGNVIGLGPFYQVEGDFHYSKLFLCLIGATSKGRKGTSLNRVRQILKLVDENWNQYRVQSGLASGEGLIHHVRDPLFKLQDGAMKEVDRGISDKRLLIEAEEFASVIAVMSKPGNTLSPV